MKFLYFFLLLWVIFVSWIRIRNTEKRICCMKCLGLGEAGEGEAELGLYAGSLLQELKEKNIK
jgi:hypothetical protein